MAPKLPKWTKLTAPKLTNTHVGSAPVGAMGASWVAQSSAPAGGTVTIRSDEQGVVARVPSAPTLSASASTLSAHAYGIPGGGYYGTSAPPGMTNPGEAVVKIAYAALKNGPAKLGSGFRVNMAYYDTASACYVIHLTPAPGAGPTEVTLNGAALRFAPLATKPKKPTVPEYGVEGSLLGIRTFSVDNEGYLVSKYDHKRFEPFGVHKAYCAHDSRRYYSATYEPGEHDSPVKGCTCGWHAFYDRERLIEYGDIPPSVSPSRSYFYASAPHEMAWVVVEGGGSVVPSERGFRSEYLTIRAVIFERKSYDVMGYEIDLEPAHAALAERYGVPLLLPEELKGFYGERGAADTSPDAKRRNVQPSPGLEKPLTSLVKAVEKTKLELNVAPKPGPANVPLEIKQRKIGPLSGAHDPGAPVYDARGEGWSSATTGDVAADVARAHAAVAAQAKAVTKITVKKDAWGDLARAFADAERALKESMVKAYEAQINLTEAMKNKADVVKKSGRS